MFKQSSKNFGKSMAANLFLCLPLCSHPHFCTSSKVSPFFISSRLIHYNYKTLLSSINPINIINLQLSQFLNIYSTDFYSNNRQYVLPVPFFFSFYFILAFHYYSITTIKRWFSRLRMLIRWFYSFIGIRYLYLTYPRLRPRWAFGKMLPF